MEKKGVLFLAIYLETENSSVVFLSEGEDRLGTLAVSMPQEEKMVGPPLSSVLLGDRNATIARILAERLAQTMNKIALVSVFTKTVDDREAAPILLKLVRKITEREAVEP
ncbi:hypothetical protein GWN63_05890 [Candidatus Bathyarchaeota archaeon]|nr:hypothetical protein [Candidatus Bathyarchaeota archaeon]